MTRFENDDSQDHPLFEELAPGTYQYCMCGKTKTVPYCDGAHVGTGIEPMAFEITEPGASPICNCGLSENPPYCDGSHVNID